MRSYGLLHMDTPVLSNQQKHLSDLHEHYLEDLWKEIDGKRELKECIQLASFDDDKDRVCNELL